MQRVDPGTYVVREVEGKVVSQSVQSFQRLCEQMQEHYTKYTPTNLHGIDFRPGTVSNGSVLFELYRAAVFMLMNLCIRIAIFGDTLRFAAEFYAVSSKCLWKDGRICKIL